MPRQDIPGASFPLSVPVVGAWPDRCRPVFERSIAVDSAEERAVKAWLRSHSARWRPTLITYVPAHRVAGENFNLNFCGNSCVLNYGANERRDFVRRGSPDPAVRPTVGLQVTGPRSETAVAEYGLVRRPCPNQPGGASPRSPRWDNPIPCLVPRTGKRASDVRGLVSTRRGSEASGTNAPFWPGACATKLQHAAPFGSWLQ